MNPMFKNAMDSEECYKTSQTCHRICADESSIGTNSHPLELCASSTRLSTSNWTQFITECKQIQDPANYQAFFDTKKNAKLLNFVDQKEPVARHK